MVRSGLTLVCRAKRKMKPNGGGHVTCHYFMRRNVYLMLSTFCRCMGITCNIWGRAQDPTQLPHKLRGGGSRACFRLSGLALFDDYAGALGNYDIIFSLFCCARPHFYFLSIMTRISELTCLALPALQTRDAYIDVHGIVCNGEITELLLILKVLNLFLRPRHCFVWWSTLK